MTEKLTLLLMRHGKSDWGELGLADHDRTLTKRGKRDAKAMGAALDDVGLVPDRVYSSSARRARSTARRVAAQCECEDQVVVHPGLYYDGVNGCLATLAQSPDDAKCVLMVGHNPTMEDLVSHFSRHYVAMVTSTVACIEFDAQSWFEVVHGAAKGTLRFVWTPRELRAAKP